MNVETVQSQVKLQMLDMKWQKKKSDINQKNDNLSQEEILMKSLEEQAEEVRKGRDTEQIYTKLKTGGTLTADEISYLKEHDPEALADYENAQAEKKTYKQALKNCRTKEDVERLKLNRMGNYAATAKSIATSPYIPQDKKLELMNKLNNEVCCIRDAHLEFVKSSAYKELPKEAEISEEKAEEKDAENNEILALEVEAAEGADETDTSASKEERYMHPELEVLHSKSDETKHKNEMDKESVVSEDMSYDKISQDIQRYLRKNGDKKSSLVVRV